MHSTRRTVTNVALGFGLIVAQPSCTEDDSGPSLEGTSTGQATADPDDGTGQPAGSDGAPEPDVGRGPTDPLEMGPIDADGCFGYCFADKDPINTIVNPYCDVELRGEGEPIVIPECDGTSPDDYAPPAGADACHWFAVDNEHWGITPDDPRDDTADACQPNNASFKFVETVDGFLAAGQLYATCGHRPDTIPYCCDAEDECDR